MWTRKKDCLQTIVKKTTGHVKWLSKELLFSKRDYEWVLTSHSNDACG